MELLKGGDMNCYLNELGKPLGEASARKFMKQIHSAVTYLHSNGVVHRDLKVENLLLDESRTFIKIADLGLANFIRRPSDVLSSRCGTLVNMAPEMFTDAYSFEVDIWAMGVILFAMLSLDYPFLDDNPTKL